MESENFIIGRNGKTKSIKETIYRNNLSTILTDTTQVRTENTKASKTAFKLRTLTTESTMPTHDKNETSLKKSKFSTIEHSTSLSLPTLLPPINKNPYRRKYPKNYDSISGQKFSKVECFFNTEMRLKQNIRNSINNRSIFNENRRNESENQKIRSGKVIIDSEKEAGNIVQELYENIKSKISHFDSKEASNGEKRILKKNMLRIIRRKNDYSVINGKFTYFNLVNDKELMCRVFNENMSHIAGVVETFDSAKRQNLLASYKLV